MNTEKAHEEDRKVEELDRWKDNPLVERVIPRDRWICLKCGALSRTRFLTDGSGHSCGCDQYEFAWAEVGHVLDFVYDENQEDAFEEFCEDKEAEVGGLVGRSQKPQKPDPDKFPMEEFEALARPLIEWLNNNYHPHTSIRIDNTGAELCEGVMSFVTEDYLLD